MRKYCLDTNVLIEAKNGPYAFDIAPSFWELIHENFEQRIVITSSLVYKELTEGDDDLAIWIRAQKDLGCFIEPDKNVQDQFSAIADYVNGAYPQNQSASFLNCADPWVIALAKATDTVVVTQEVLVGRESKKVKIPNVCQQFNVLYIGTYQMLRELKANIKF